MATRRQLTAQRDQLAAAKARLADVNVRIGRHVTGCSRCCMARGQPSRMCDAGWQLMKEQARANAAVRRTEDSRAAGPVQGKLW